MSPREAPGAADGASRPQARPEEARPAMPPQELIEDAANILGWRGHAEPGDDEEWDPALIAALAEIALSPCSVCATPEGWCRTPDAVADHWVERRQQEWEQSLPTWACDCGRVFKRLSQPRGDSLWEARDDGLLGDAAGDIVRDAKGRVKHSGSCPGCGRSFATTMADQASPQQALF